MPNKPSPEQSAVIDPPLKVFCVIACAGSGKTFTAVRRIDVVRKLLQGKRGNVALLSFSNVAVDVFGQNYLQDFGGTGLARVCIETFDGFITKNIIRTHASRTMGCPTMPFLLTGEEEFLANKNYKFWPKDFTFPIEATKVEVEYRGGTPQFFSRTYRTTTEISNGEYATRRLGVLGAYTHSLGRYWAYQTLKQQPLILSALARRYPQIIVDEAQDIGSMQVALLELLAKAGAQISLIGDPNQAIFEFSGSDGEFLRGYPSRPGVERMELTINYRSVPRIVEAANSLAQRSDRTYRDTPATDNGAFFIPLGKAEKMS